MNKYHPCQKRNKRFQIVRVGADIKIRCLACGNLIMMEREKFDHAIRRVLEHHEGPLSL